MPPKNNRKAPRVDAYQRLLARFHEPLILLRALGKTWGEYTPAHQESGTFRSIRRRFLDNLCYICDHKKGGDTTASIGLEEREDRFNFWVASNQNSVKIADFVEEILRDVKLLGSSLSNREDSKKQQFIHKCIDFAKPRIGKEASLLTGAIKKHDTQLSGQSRPEEYELLKWLQAFDAKDSIALCERAYDLRKAPQMKEMRIRSQVLKGEAAKNDIAATLAVIRHMLGRLAHHVRAPKQVIDDASHLEELLERYFVLQIPILECIPPPAPDGLTTLESMLKRMLPANDPSLPKYEAALLNLDQKLQIKDRVLELYHSSSFRPRVHSEIQVLEHFYKNKLTFAADDRYIATSKPACYCCHLYIRNHPLDIVEPPSHKNLYLAWGVPLLKGATNDPEYKHQQKILNKMLEAIRRDALDQIMSRTVKLKTHPDSLTGITPSLSMVSNTKSIQTGSLDGQLALLTIKPENNDASSGTSHDGVGESDLEESTGSSWTSSNENIVGRISKSDEINSDSDSDDDSVVEGGARLA
ncbi:hypothetical protein SUNI508_01796 [Seiridium unicorne]|uniref:Uncharacterized protein n=1 Tax=Seiridium unicorne TaxID=138068 RepID=A0ABR2UPC6_9PEZI